LRSTSGAVASSDGAGNQNLIYRYEIGQTAQAADQATWSGPAASASLEQLRHAVIQSGRPAQAQVADCPTLVLPIQVRDQVIGVASFIKNPAPPDALNAQTASARPADRLVKGPTPGWNTEEVELLETIVEQLGVAIDSARLYHDSQRMAYREQLVGEVTGRIRQTLDLQTVMRTAVEEIQRTLNLPEVVISLAPPDEEVSPEYTSLAPAPDQG